MTDLEGKVAFVTGGVSGIGLGVARAFVSAGAKVVITYLTKSHSQEAMKCFEGVDDRVHAMRLDVTDRIAVAAAAEETVRIFGKIHFLCNSAGVNSFGPMDEATFGDWDWIMGVNVGGTINTLVAFIPFIKAHGEGGHIVNVASMSALLVGPEAGIYTTSKFAVRGLSEALRYALAPHGIGVSVFCPGLVQSNIHESERNRPIEFEGASALKDASFIARWRDMLALGMDPVEAGRRVLQGIQRNDLYIISHPELKEDLRTSFDELLATFPDELPDPNRMAVVEARRRSIKAVKELIARQSRRKQNG